MCFLLMKFKVIYEIGGMINGVEGEWVKDVFLEKSKDWCILICLCDVVYSI